jgi:SAM-dependent methyltransferase
VTNLAQDHYNKLLGPLYSWMVGDIDAATSRADAELEAIGLPSHADGIAIDLGAGFGMHSLPLARRGYEVIAVDSYAPLLTELKSRAGSRAIRTVNADLMEFNTHVLQPANLVLCMGDTLTHLPDTASVEVLFSTVSDALVPGGLFVVTFRDYVSDPHKGDGRFILVRSDESRILTCFLDYGETTVQVHDILHERVGGQWRLQFGSYRKLRLSPLWVVTALTSLGFIVRREQGLSGMVRVVAARMR